MPDQTADQAAPPQRRRPPAAGIGRKKGVPNKATAEVKALAREYSEEAMRELARLSTKARSEPARVMAIKEILDRAYGKATQPMQHSVDEGLEALLDRLAT